MEVLSLQGSMATRKQEQVALGEIFSGYKKNIP